jgi:type I restriction enzyme S subunit
MNKVKRDGNNDAKLGVIPDGWSTPKISDVFQFINTTSFSREQLNYDEENEVFYIHYGDIHATYKKPILDFDIETKVPRLNPNVELPNNIQYLKNGDVIIADASEDYEGVGEAIEIKNLNGKAAISGLHTFALRDLDCKTVPGFRTYIFKNPNVKKELKTIATGSKVYGISKGNIQKFKIVLPPLPEQQKIAQILATWDIAINKQETLIAQKKQQKKGLMQQLLSGNKRLDGFTEEWGQVKLKDISSLITKGTTPSSIGFKFLEVGVNFIKAENISKDGIIDIESTPKISESCNEALKRSILKTNDILFSIAGTLGRTAIVKLKDLPANTNQALSIIRLKRGFLSYINYQLNTEIIDRYVLKMVSVGAQPNLNLQQVGNIEIPFPEIEEQQKIAEVLTAADNEITALQQQLQQLKTQKQGLMQQLLSGKIRVKTN